MGPNWKRAAATAFAAAAALLLSGCLLTAGKFQSELTLMKDGSFSYSYDGEIQMLALSELAGMSQQGAEQFTPTTCYDDKSFEERECTAEELVEQRSDWDLGAAASAEKQALDIETAKAMLGGIDPSSPEAGREIAERLVRQHGWNKVEYVGNGLFDVEYAVTGRLTHDFTFPVMERLPMGNAFLSAILRDGNQLRVDAPGFVVQDQSDPTRGMMAGMMGMASMANRQESEEGEDAAPAAPRIVLPQGTFTIVTDGAILANNTDEGPAAHARGKALVWNVSTQSQQAPMALIDLSR